MPQRRLKRLMRSLSANKLTQLGNKIRRIVLCAIRSEYVERQTAIRGGECVGCGKCCKLVFRCPFLGGTDESPRCLVYDDRPKPCQAFPIDERDLVDVNYQCGYFFPHQLPVNDLVQVKIQTVQNTRIPVSQIPDGTESLLTLN
jgi:hypothetical protein